MHTALITIAALLAIGLLVAIFAILGAASRSDDEDEAIYQALLRDKAEHGEQS